MPRSTWQRLCPLGDWQGPILTAIERVLDRDDVRAALAECEASGRYPTEVLAMLREKGLGELFSETASAYHIHELNALAARRSGSLAITLGINGLALLPVFLAATDEQRQRVFAEMRAGALAAILLSEWDHGSDLLATSTRARAGTVTGNGQFVAAPENDSQDEPGNVGSEVTHYQLSGEKRLINGVARASLLITLARTAERNEREKVFGSAMGLSLFMVRPDATIEPLERFATLPVKGADIAGVRFANTLVPAAELLGRPGEGYGLVQKALNLSRGGISAFAAGMTNRAAELGLAHARERVLYGEPILALDAVAEHVARLLALDLATTCLARKALAVVNARGQDAAHYTAVAKYAAAELAEAAVAEGRRVLSARALIAGPFEPLMRDVLVLGIFDGTSHVMLEHIQWRLAQMISGRGQGRDNSVAEVAAMYQAGPAPLLEVARRGGRRPWLPHIARHMSGLAEAAGAPVAAAARDLAAIFMELCTALVGGEAWKNDQVVRHQAASLLAYLEAMAATMELGAPAVRARLGMAPVDAAADDGAGAPVPWELAVALLGCRVAADLRQLAQSAGLAAAAELLDVEAALVSQRIRAARELRAALHETRKPT